MQRRRLTRAELAAQTGLSKPTVSASVRRLAPKLGEHTREVLREVGYGEAEIEALVERKAVRAG